MSMKTGARSAFVSSVSVVALLAAGAAHAQETAVTPEEAQTAPTPGGVPEPEIYTGIEEIVVTAQRQAESLQDVPIAVSAFSDEALQAQQLENTLDLQQALPNTTFTKGNFTGANITIRGIGSAVVAASGNAGVGVHFNDMPLVSSRLFETEFFDLERIEVLRGPQGTLFGRNATGGVVNLITAKPRNEFQAAGEFEYGNFDSIQAKGMVNVPLGDIAAVRAAGIYLNRDGFTNNLNTGNDIDGRDYYAVRGSFLLEPTDRTTFIVTAQYFEEDSNRSRIQKQLCATDTSGILGCRPDRLDFDTVNGDATLGSTLTSNEFLAIASGGALGPFGLGSLYGDDGNLFDQAVVPRDVRTVAIDFEPTWNSDQLILHGELTHEFDNFTLSLNGGYAENSFRSRTDYNLTTTNSLAPQIGFLQALAGGAAGPGAQAVAGSILASPLFQGNQICVSEVNRNYVGFINGEINRCADNTTEYDESGSENEQWAIEGRIASAFDGPFNFLLGGIYLESDTTQSDYFVAASSLDYAGLLLGGNPIPGQGAALGPPFFNSETNLASLESYGIFGEVYVDLTDTLSLTGGLRYSNDDIFVRARTFLLDFPIPFGSATIDDTLNFLVDNNVTGPDGDFVFDADGSQPGAQAFGIQTVSFDEFTGRVVLDWNPDVAFTNDTLLYASYSRGYKAGGVNPPFDPVKFPDVPTTFQPEIVNAFEIGTKNVLLDGTAQINLTGFYYDYKDFQVSRIVARTSFNDNTNAEIWGLELETVLNPTPGLTINASASYLDTKIKDLLLDDTRDPSGGRSDAVIIKDIQNASNCVVTGAQPGLLSQATLAAIVNGFNAVAGDPDGPAGPAGSVLRDAVPVPGTSALGAFSFCESLAGFLASGASGVPADAFNLIILGDGTAALPGGIPVDLDGNELLNSPNWKFSVGAQYEFETAGGWTITPRADLNFTGDFFATNFNKPVDKMAAYEIVNAQLTVSSPDDRFYVRGFIQNAFDTDAQTGRFITDQSSGLFTNIFTVEPRRYGAAVGFRF